MNQATATAVLAEFPGFIGYHGAATVVAGTAVEYADALGSGTFGAVHPVTSVAGTAPAVAIVVKVFDPAELRLGGGEAPLIDAVTGLHDALPGVAGTDWAEEFRALPYQFLTLQTRDGDRLAALMLDLAALGYHEAPFAEDHELLAYRKLTVDARTALAQSVAQRLERLERVGFVHGDLNPENMMWHPQTGDVQLIDFDSGTIVRTPADRPRVAGKGDAFMPPEVQDATAPAGVDLARFTPEAERWSCAIVIGYFLFSVHPACFLAELSPTSIAAYARAPERWPDIDQSGPLFTKDPAQRNGYPQVLKVFSTVPSEVTETFAALFNAGLDAAARPSAGDWLAALQGLSDPPTVEILLLTDAFALEGDDVVVAWRAENATHVDLVPGGRQPPSGSMRYIAKEHFRVTATAYNAFGADTAETPVVRVVPLPRLERLAVPDLPGLRLTPFSHTAQVVDGRAEGADAAPPPPAVPLFAGSMVSRSPAHAPGHLEIPPPPQLHRFPSLLGGRPPARRSWGR